MSERGARQVEREASQLRIAGSRMRWDGGTLRLDVDEIAMPIPRRVVGTVRFVPDLLNHEAYALDPEGLHWWQPFAPIGRVEVDFEHPKLHWSGQGYVDCNHGAVPLEQSFESWQWSRISGRNQTTVLYDIKTREAGAHEISLQFSPSRGSEEISRPNAVRLPSTRWGLPRSTRAAEDRPRLIKTLEDAPFYSRSLLASPQCGGIQLGVHESLSLQRFEKNWVRCLLPFRMPRWAR